MTDAPDSRRCWSVSRQGPLLFVAVLAWPLPGLSTAAHTLAAIFGWAAPAVLAPYADPVVFLFLGSFILAEATRSS